MGSKDLRLFRDLLLRASRGDVKRFRQVSWAFGRVSDEGFRNFEDMGQR